MSIELTNLTKIFGVQRAVNGISMKAGKGEIVGFLGPNGAGKSTTMKMITGYLRPDAGQALVCGTDMAKSSVEAKQNIGYLPESNALYLDMYVREYLAFAGSVYKLPSLKAVVSEVIEKVGLLPEAHKKIGQLSKGYKQRVGLAAAILHKPEVLILDEPTSGLDPNQIVEIRQVIKDLGAEKTVLLSTHIMQEVEAICDRVVIIHKGSLVADDSLANLKKSGQRKSLTVAFEEVLEPEWLSRLPAAQLVEKLDRYSWLMHTLEPDLLRRQLLQMANDHSLNVVSLQNSGGTLEDIFRSLTKTQVPAAESEAASSTGIALP